MTWVWAYLAVGAIFSVFAVTLGLRAREPGSLSGLRRPKDFALAIAVSVTLWPLGLVVLMSARRDEPLREPEPFSPNAADFLQELSLEQVKARERVVDPLGAVPNLPFGHLHESWATFRDALPANARLHAFRAKRRERFGRAKVREGYVFGSGAGMMFICTDIFDDVYETADGGSKQ